MLRQVINYLNTSVKDIIDQLIPFVFLVLSVEDMHRDTQLNQSYPFRDTNNLNNYISSCRAKHNDDSKCKSSCTFL